jgi:hypothetical protein
MHRPNGLTEYADRLLTWAKDVTYGPAGELTQVSYLAHKFEEGLGGDQYWVESRSYNSLLQMSRLTTRIENNWVRLLWNDGPLSRV